MPRAYTQAEIRACWTTEIAQKLLRAVELANVSCYNSDRIRRQACVGTAVDILREIGEVLKAKGFDITAPEDRKRPRVDSSETVRILNQIRRDRYGGVRGIQGSDAGPDGDGGDSHHESGVDASDR